MQPLDRATANGPRMSPGYMVIYLDGELKEVEIVSGYKWRSDDIDIVLKDGRKINVSCYLSYIETEVEIEQPKN